MLLPIKITYSQHNNDTLRLAKIKLGLLIAVIFINNHLKRPY
jgi:hypothetical protein